jgi:hypothetical protein
VSEPRISVPVLVLVVVAVVLQYAELLFDVHTAATVGVLRILKSKLQQSEWDVSWLFLCINVLCWALGFYWMC